MESLKSPLVSVVVPCLNRKEYIGPTLESILRQDYPNIECIVIDGGSTDGTLEVLRSYNNKIRWISEPDKGNADAINKGFRLCKGEILAWLNADDLWEIPSAVTLAVEYFQTHPDVDLVYGDCGAIDENGKRTGMSYLHEWDLEYAVLHCDHCIPQPSAFIKRKILEDSDWLDSRYVLMDRDLWFRLGMKGKIVHLPLLLAHARSNASFWHSKSSKVAEECVEIITKFYDQPNIPKNILRRKKRAISNAYLRGTEYAAVGKDWSKIFRYCVRAFFADPTNFRAAWGRLRHFAFVGSRENRSCKRLYSLTELLMAPIRSYRHLKQWKMFPAIPAIPNLAGDRDIEWSWVTAKIPDGPGTALDFGPSESFLALTAAQKGFEVTAVDRQDVQWKYIHPAMRFLKADLLQLNLPADYFDLVINCSTVEHVGLSGRYGETEDKPDGDLEAMRRLKNCMKPGGVMLLTIPVGRDAIFPPLCRVYGKQRLPLLLQGLEIESEVYWTKNPQNQWIPCEKDVALNFEAAAGSWDPLQNSYGLGCFVLRRP